MVRRKGSAGEVEADQTILADVIFIEKVPKNRYVLRTLSVNTSKLFFARGHSVSSLDSSLKGKERCTVPIRILVPTTLVDIVHQVATFALACTDHCAVQSQLPLCVRVAYTQSFVCTYTQSFYVSAQSVPHTHAGC